ncbi:DUF4132 domain-containing protein [Glycomyces sp. TRM65418]|uniref:DUF4132 domain-containing protein n=1 Tax=Glycomyces sp. TRM65418 TaxID=2867006 RepID=UPI001CE5C16C|nr:DUF4132 domain-containing protein [Glycomyces sp. TRM65418]MCC3764339.1 DUF4132 domain-containing protein [Glycomyces sp. TRM65418]QZD54018.1 DUF4132 domain-containing protein [Glycomyces sp. TRM65418]
MPQHVAPQDDRPELPEAALDRLPSVLADPPWTRKRRRSKAPTVIPGLEAPAPQLVGRPGEFEAALAIEPTVTEWDEAEYWDGDPESPIRLPGFFGAGKCLSQLARKGVAVADAAVRELEDEPWSGRALLPIRSTPAARLAAHWALRRRDGRRPGLDWFDRHGLRAVPFLVPEAFGPQAYRRTSARSALRLLSWRYGSDAVVGAAEPHGPEAVAAVAALFDTDPHQPLLEAPQTGAWVHIAENLPPVLTADRAAILPPAAIRHLIEVLCQWAPRVPYPGLDAAAAHCDRESLARFSLALAEELIGVDWAIGPLAYFGLPEGAALLEAAIPSSGGREPETTAFELEVLAAFPAEIAFPPLYRLSRGTMKPAQRAEAAERARAVAERLGAEPEPLADRLAPTLGLDDPATLTIDFGPRAFYAKPDDRLKFTIVDDAGRTRPRLPRPGVRDDAATAAASIARYRKLTKDVTAQLAFQSARLEDAMLDGRLWTSREFARLTAHPVLAPIARGLLWLGGTPEAAQCFRIAEDGTLADVDDKPFALAEHDLVRLAHPALLSPADLEAWTRVFADYEILQPFDQLVRPALGLLPEEVESGILHGFTGAVASFHGLKAVMDLENLGVSGDWNARVDYTRAFSKALPGGVWLLAQVDPAPPWHDPRPDSWHRIESIWFATTKNRRQGVPTLAGQDLLEALDPVVLSELLAGLNRAAGLHL